MLDSPVVDVAIGLTFVYLVLSLCATAIVEGVAEWRQWRGRLLHAKLQNMLGKDLVNSFYCERRIADLGSGTAAKLRLNDWVAGHPNIKSLYDYIRSIGTFTSTSLSEATHLAKDMRARRLPSHIQESIFSDVMLDWLQGAGLSRASHPGVDTVDSIPDRLAVLLQRMNLKANGEPSALRAELIDWYKRCMDRTTGEFKRRIRLALYLAGGLLVFATNADTISIAKSLYENPQLRAKLVASAEEVSEKCLGTAKECEELQKHAQAVLTTASGSVSAGLLGWRPDDWKRFNENRESKLFALLGWFLTVLAIGLGADFWFGALKRIITVKNVAKTAVPEESHPPQPVETSTQGTDAYNARTASAPLDISAKVVEGLKGFQPLNFTESHIHAYWLAKLSSLTYNSPNELRASELLANHGLGVTCLDSGGTQAFVFTGKQCCIVAFRGTEQRLEDWIADADARQLETIIGPGSSPIKIHRGFQRALDLVWEDLAKLLRTLDCPVWFTGHSLGGALALLAAYRLHHEASNKKPTVGGVYTFGQPRVGNSAMVEQCSLEFVQRVFRFVNSSDIVPLVPPSQLAEYEHLGQARFFDAGGQLHAERSLWERIAEQLSPALKQVATGSGNWSAVARDHARKRVADHGMAKYVERLERIGAVRALWISA